MAEKHVLRYLKGTVGYGLRYTSKNRLKLQGYTYSNWAGSAVDRKSTSGCCFSIGSTMISWICRKQTSVALSTVEAEYIVASTASREAVWLRKLLADILDRELETTMIHCDNQRCIKLSENPVFHDRSKHVEIKYHYIRDIVQRGAVKLQYIRTDEQIADILTKPLSRLKFVYFRDKLGVIENVSLAERGSVDVSTEMQHRANILLDMVSSVLEIASKARDWMDQENSPGVALLSQMDLTTA